MPNAAEFHAVSFRGLEKRPPIFWEYDSAASKMGCLTSTNARC